MTALQSHIRLVQGTHSLPATCSEAEIAAYLNASVFPEARGKDSQKQQKPMMGSREQSAFLDSAALQQDLIENIIVPYKSHRHPFGEFLCSLITELLKINDLVLRGIHLPNLAKVQTITGISAGGGQLDDEVPNIAGLNEIMVEIDGDTP